MGQLRQQLIWRTNFWRSLGQMVYRGFDLGSGDANVRFRMALFMAEPRVVLGRHVGENDIRGTHPGCGFWFNTVRNKMAAVVGEISGWGASRDDALDRPGVWERPGAGGAGNGRVGYRGCLVCAFDGDRQGLGINPGNRSWIGNFGLVVR